MCGLKKSKKFSIQYNVILSKIYDWDILTQLDYSLFKFFEFSPPLVSESSHLGLFQLLVGLRNFPVVNFPQELNLLFLFSSDELYFRFLNF